jgi:hypothetical protein
MAKVADIPGMVLPESCPTCGLSAWIHDEPGARKKLWRTFNCEDLWHIKPDPSYPNARRKQLVINYFDRVDQYHEVDQATAYHEVSISEGGWKIDAEMRCLVIGRYPRTYIPLDRVRNFRIEDIDGQ